MFLLDLSLVFAWQVNLGLSLELFMEDQMAKSVRPLLQADGLLLCASIIFSALLHSRARAAFRLRHKISSCLQLILLCVVTRA